ncbi:MAG: hypothetical protein H7Z43_09950 [Clostridia bacterium]|nr:hypothetical protein [Deltaproteobacteria bacterium]
MPFVLFGQAGGVLETGRNLEYPFNANNDPFYRSIGAGMHHTKLLVSILNTFGFEDQVFGDPGYEQGPLDGFLA